MTTPLSVSVLRFLVIVLMPTVRLGVELLKVASSMLTVKVLVLKCVLRFVRLCISELVLSVRMMMFMRNYRNLTDTSFFVVGDCGEL